MQNIQDGLRMTLTSTPRCDMASHVYFGKIAQCSEGQFCELSSCEPKVRKTPSWPRSWASVSLL
jgi:hypothetical protein